MLERRLLALDRHVRAAFRALARSRIGAVRLGVAARNPHARCLVSHCVLLCARSALQSDRALCGDQIAALCACRQAGLSSLRTTNLGQNIAMLVRWQLRSLFGKLLASRFAMQMLADHAGIQKAHLGRLELGEKEAGLLMLEKIALALEVHPADLLR